MNKEKGFTLIELLAVIVILAIIALIAVPIILNIISDSKKQSSDRGAELYLKAAELAIARKNLDGELGDATCEIQEDGNLKCTTSNNRVVDVKVEVDGTKPTEGTIVFSNGKISGETKLTYEDGTEYKPKTDTINSSESVPEVPASGDSDDNADDSTSLTSAHISSQQIWDCQRTPSLPREGYNFTLSGLQAPISKDWVSWNPQSDNYLKVVINNGKARLDEYDPNGNKVREFSYEGTLYLLDRERHIYFFDGSLGYVFCTDPVEAEIFKNNNGGSFPYEGIEIVESID